MNRKLYLFPFFLSFLFIFSGCFGSSSPSDGGEDLITVQKSPVSISVPKNWREVKEENFKSLGNNVVLAYSSLVYTNGFANNISITKEILDQPFSSLQYAQANIINSAKYLTDYVKLDEKNVTIKDAEGKDIETRIHIFEARFDLMEKKRKYLQLYATNGMNGYTVTVATSLEENDLIKFENLLTSFHFVP